MLFLLKNENLKIAYKPESSGEFVRPGEDFHPSVTLRLFLFLRCEL
jgi:hypothetical protein